MAYFRSVLILNALSVNRERIGFSLFASSAMVIAVSSAQLMVWRSDCVLISMCVVVCVVGSTIDDPSVSLPVIWEEDLSLQRRGPGTLPMGAEGHTGIVGFHRRLRHNRPLSPRGVGGAHSLEQYHLHRCYWNKRDPHHHAGGAGSHTHGSYQIRCT